MLFLEGRGARGGAGDFPPAERDPLAVPSCHALKSRADGPPVLFSHSDRAAQENPRTSREGRAAA